MMSMKQRILFAMLGICAFFFIFAMFAPNAIADENQVGHENGLLGPLVEGEWYTAITSVYTQVLGMFFHVLIFLLGPTLIGIKSQRFAPVSMAILISGIVFAMLFETPMQFFFAVAAILGLAGVFYSVVHK